MQLHMFFSKSSKWISREDIWTDNLCFSINACNIADCTKTSIVLVFLMTTLIVWSV